MVVQFEDRRGNRSFHRRNGIKFVCVSRFSIPVLTKSNDDNNRQLEIIWLGRKEAKAIIYTHRKERYTHRPDLANPICAELIRPSRNFVKE